jgi:hypothetical protein
MVEVHVSVTLNVLSIYVSSFYFQFQSFIGRFGILSFTESVNTGKMGTAIPVVPLLAFTAWTGASLPERNFEQ